MGKCLGFTGAAIAFVGVFMPFVRLPFLGSLNYFQNGKGDGTIIILLAAFALWALATQRYKGVMISGFGMIGMLAISFYSFQSKLSQIRSDMARDLAGNPFAGLASAAINSIQLEFGWAIIGIGAIMLVFSGFSLLHAADKAEQDRKVAEEQQSGGKIEESGI